MKLKSQNKKDALAEILKRNIVKGKYKKGDKFPSTVTLAALFGVTKETVNSAMTHLVSQGFICREQGKGSFVCFDPEREKNKHKTIGLYLAGLSVALTPEDAPYNYAIVHGAMNAAEARGYRVLILGRRDTVFTREKLEQAPIDGAMVCGVGSPAARDFMSVLKKTNMPYVVEFGETAATALIDLIEGKITAPVTQALRLKLLEGRSRAPFGRRKL